MDQGRNTRQASCHKDQCSKEAIFCALEPGVQRHKDSQRPEDSNLSSRKRKALDPYSGVKTRKGKNMRM